MLIRTICLAAPVDGAVHAAVTRLSGQVAGLRQVQGLAVLRHIPTDSVVDDGKSHRGVVPDADRIAAVLELYFDDAAAATQGTSGAAWAGFMEQLGAAAPVLFAFDTLANIPIAPRAAALRGGFRRWMLLARKASTQEQFRDAWFGRHASLVRELPHVDGYLQNLITKRHDPQGREVDYDALPVDGIAELCFADEAAMNAAYSSQARLALRDDGRDLLGRITTVLVHGDVIA
jgi:hypothetical protein